MIARVWHGVVPESKGARYLELLQRTGVKDIRAVEGNRGVYVLRRVEDGRTHFLFISLWESMAAVRKFAGENVDKAFYYPEDKDFLLEFEPTVSHYEVAVKP
jgi:heme-degrading monooxygenase HmoA